MPVDTPHPKYSAACTWWERCRDCKGGSDAVKAKGVLYLPRLEGQTAAGEYDAYKARALFYPATDRTVAGLMGAILRKPPAVTAPDSIEPHLQDVTNTGKTLTAFCIEALEEVLTTGRLGMLLDMPATGDVRPYWVLYTTEQIINWRVEKVTTSEGERRRLTMLVLKEEVPEPDPKDPFVTKCITQYRHLELVGGVYTVRLWRQEAGGDRKWAITETIVPARRGAPLDEIPFVITGSRDLEADPDKPPLLDVVDVNLSHYRSSADLEHGRHFTALPTPYVTGISGQVALAIGSATAWTLSDVNSKVGMLEFTGTGLGSLVTALQHKEELMAILGARLLEGQPSQQETAEAVRMRHAGEHATLTTIALAVGQALTQVLRWHVWWTGLEVPEDDVSITLNTEFVEMRLTAEEAKTALLMWQSEAISAQTYYWNLQRGGWARPGVSLEQERAEIASDPVGAALPAAPGRAA